MDETGGGADRGAGTKAQALKSQGSHSGVMRNWIRDPQVKQVCVGTEDKRKGQHGNARDLTSALGSCGGNVRARRTEDTAIHQHSLSGGLWDRSQEAQEQAEKDIQRQSMLCWCIKDGRGHSTPMY